MLFTMEVSSFGYRVPEKRVLVRFPCNTASSSARRTPSSKRLEPPRKALNLSPEPVPKKVISDHRAPPSRVRKLGFMRRGCIRGWSAESVAPHDRGGWWGARHGPSALAARAVRGSMSGAACAVGRAHDSTADPTRIVNEPVSKAFTMQGAQDSDRSPDRPARRPDYHPTAARWRRTRDDTLLITSAPSRVTRTSSSIRKSPLRFVALGGSPIEGSTQSTMPSRALIPPYGGRSAISGSSQRSSPMP